jgi:hypothetical protein
MLTFEIFFLICLSVVNSQRYYAFVETLFVIDQNYFPPLSHISHDDYIRTIVDTSNIVEIYYFSSSIEIISIVDITITK